jgi:gamma-glutamylcyclotransferase (GGCT)/AIG2-like uncharacterized protein YtfP
VTRDAVELLFVYGTLRSDAGHPMRDVLSAAGSRIGPATTIGTLLRIDWYPGLLLAPGPGPVIGELWQIHHGGIWPRLDAYEGCGESDEPPHEYVRRPLQTLSESLGEASAWAYVYTGPEDGCEVIQSGDWLRAHDTTR